MQDQKGLRIGLVAFLVFAFVAFGLAASAHARGGWAEIPYAYSYEAEVGEDAYIGTDNALGNLDGEWRRSSNSDEWDGSTPEPGDGSPGGVVVQELPGDGEDGGTATVLDIEDVGNPGGSDPNNRKIFLWRDTSAELDLADGVTLVARWRLNPEPLAAEFANNGGSLPVPSGTNLHDGGKGQIGFVQKSAVLGMLPATLALAITDLGYLQFSYDFGGAGCTGAGFPTERCFDVDEYDWVTVWFSAQEEAGGVRVLLYLNGEEDPVVDEVLLGLPAGAETATLPEAGSTASSYIDMALGSTGQDGAIQIDYVAVAAGFQEPSLEVPECPHALTGTPEGKNVVLGWRNGTRSITQVDVYRDGNLLAAAAPVSPPTYVDPNVEPGTYDYELRFEVPGVACGSLAATVSTCPRQLRATADAHGVLLRWTNAGEPAGLRVLRDGVEIAGDLAGTSTTYLDLTVTNGTHTYRLEPTTGTCEPLEVVIAFRSIAPGGDFGGDPVEWTYELDPPLGADPEEYLLFQPIANTAGALDGLWSRGNGSDSWDSSAPGNIGDPAEDVAGQPSPPGEAPGGIGLVDSGEVGAYLIEDVGDPTAQGYADPSNRKIYVAYDMSQSVEGANLRSLISDGITLRVRFRLTPPDEAVDVLDAPNGMIPNNGGKGIFTIAHDLDITGIGTNQRIGVGLERDAQDPSGAGILFIGQDANLMRIPVVDPTAWIDLWLTAEDADGDPVTPEIRLTLYANGSPDPLLELEDFIPNDGGAEYAGPGNSLYMGLCSTPESGSVQVDLVAFVDGVVAPVVEQKPRFRRGDADAADGKVNITDVIFLLNHLFRGGAEPPCLDAADADNEFGLNITDGIYSLRFLFLGGPEPPAPGPTECGPDPPADPPSEPAVPLDCKSYPAGC